MLILKLELAIYSFIHDSLTEHISKLLKQSFLRGCLKKFKTFTILKGLKSFRRNQISETSNSIRLSLDFFLYATGHAGKMTGMENVYNLSIEKLP